MNPPETLLKAWTDYLKTCQAAINGIAGSGTPGVGSLPFAGAWQDMAKSLGMPLGSPAETFKPENASSVFMAALGNTREYQLIAQHMIELSARFQQQYAEFTELGAEIQRRAQAAVEVQANLAEASATDPAALYDAWIDRAEQAYSQVAQGEDFARLLGEMVNGLSSFKVERGKLQEALARSLDLPTRSEVDTLHRQVRELTSALHADSRGADKPKSRPRKRHKAPKP
jgi:class III poly(R)-hydroxyalkanoic acid synthase PhaE subunit